MKAGSLIILLIGSCVSLFGQPSYWFPKRFLDTASSWTNIQFPTDRSCAIQAVRVSKINNNYAFDIKTNATEEFVNFKQKVVKKGKIFFVEFFEELVVSNSGRFSDSFASKAKYYLEFLPGQELVIKLRYNKVEKYQIFCNGLPLKEIKNPDFDLPMYYIVSNQYSVGDNPQKLLTINSSGEFSEDIYDISAIRIVGQILNPESGFLHAYLIEAKVSSGSISLIAILTHEKVVFKKYEQKTKSIGHKLFELKKPHIP